jgi:hypothetical protein
MAERIIPCGPAPLATIRAKNNLSLRGGASSQIRVMMEDLHDLTVVDVEGGLRITCEEDCALTVPADARVVIEEVGGSASIGEVSGGLRVHKVEGNLTLNRVGDVECREVDGNLRVDSCGSLKIDALGGNLKGGRLSGALNVHGVGGNIKLAAVAGLEKARAGGNVRIGLTAIQSDMEITAGGNIAVGLPPNAGFTLDATSGGQNVTVDIGGTPGKLRGSTVGIRFGAGGPRLKLTAGGNITLSDRIAEKADDEEIGVEVDWSATNERIHKRIEEKIRLAEQRMGAERRRAEQRVQEAMKKVAGMDLSGIINTSLSKAGWQAVQNEPEGQPVVESEPVTDAEKMLVLTMLQEKKITAEEAERLLDALAGKFD